MSKIGRMPIAIKEGITVTVNGQVVTVSGTKGNATFTIPSGILVKVEEGKVIVSQEKGREELTRPLFGLTRATIANLMKGVSTGFEKKLELSGVGYRAQASGS